MTRDDAPHAGAPGDAFAPDRVAPAPAAQAVPRGAAGQEELVARVAWSIVAEPGDATAGAVVGALGAGVALGWAAWAVGVGPTEGVRLLRALVREAPERATARVAETAGAAGTTGTTGAAGAAGAGGLPGAPAAGRSPGAAGTDGPRGTGGLLGTDSARPPGATALDARDERWLRVVGRALERWAPRLADLDPLRALDRADAVGAVLLHPGHPDWPHGLDDLGPAAPLALWVRGPADPAALLGRAVAVVGARAATVYGRRVASDLAGGLAARDVTVVSGGAFGIDVAAHRAALAAGGVSVAFLAGGIDRPSPVANLDVLEALVAGGGALVAESPPGSTPTRSRFLQRNRLIAACTRATVVVEAAWRSGALSTASRAAELLRPVGAVPGPVTSMASAGCHRLLRDGGAVCITGVDDVLELVGPPPFTRPHAPAPGPAMRSAAESTGGVPRAVAPGAQGSPHREGRRGVLDDGPGGRGALDDGPGGRGRLGEGPPGRAAVGEAPARHPAVEHTHGARSSPSAGTGRGTAAQAERAAADRADSVESRVLDAMTRGSADVPEIARRAGLAVRDVQSALGLLELRRVVERSPAGWRRVRASRGR